MGWNRVQHSGDWRRSVYFCNWQPLQLSQTSTNGQSKTITDATDQPDQLKSAYKAGTSGAGFTFHSGSGQGLLLNTPIYTGGTDVQHLVSAINSNSATLGLSASFDATQTGTGAIYLQASTAGVLAGGVIASNSTLADTTYSSNTLGTLGGVSGTGANALTTAGAAIPHR